jgi:sporulation protein YlmC with PRC-barrel domain
MTAPAPTRSKSSIAASARELHVEQLLGRRVRDRDGTTIGRIEEMIVEIRGTDWVVTEIHLGRSALLERLGDISALIPLLGKMTARSRQRWRVRWDQLDFSHPERPRTLVRSAELERA